MSETPSDNKKENPDLAKNTGVDDEEDPWITRIKRSGCFKEHEMLQDCYYVKKDWRLCKEEMSAFRKCFAQHNSNSEHLKTSHSDS